MSQGTATSVIDRTTIAGNRTLGSPGTAGGAARGGGLYSDHALTITNSTIANNTATAGASSGAGNPGTHASGGGIYNSGQLALVGDTVTGNAATAGAPGAGGAATPSEGGGQYTTAGVVPDARPQASARRAALPATLPAAARARCSRPRRTRPGPTPRRRHRRGEEHNHHRQHRRPGAGRLRPVPLRRLQPDRQPQHPRPHRHAPAHRQGRRGPAARPAGQTAGPLAGAPGATLPTLTERVLPGSPAPRRRPRRRLHRRPNAPLATDERGLVRPFGAGCEIGAYEASVLTSGGPFATAANVCGVFIGFFAPGGTGLSLRTGDGPRTVVSYLSLAGPAGRVTALPLVPRLGATDTLACTAPDPAFAPAAAAAATATATVDARVARSGNPAIPVGTLLRAAATRTATAETVTVSAINPDNSTGATLTLTNVVQPNSFVVRRVPNGPMRSPSEAAGEPTVTRGRVRGAPAPCVRGPHPPHAPSLRQLAHRAPPGRRGAHAPPRAPRPRHPLWSAAVPLKERDRHRCGATADQGRSGRWK